MDVQKRVIVRDAFGEGLVAAAITTGMIGCGVVAAHRFVPVFRARVSTSGKVAIVAMSALAAFSVQSEGRILQGARNPDEYLASMDRVKLKRHLTGVQEHSLEIHHRVANWVYDHPFRTITILGIPIVGAIFYEQQKNKRIKLSQQIMHTRVYGQGSIILLLLSSMAFHDWMDRNGRFE